MIELATTSITIGAPVDTVFKYVTNMENYKQWFPGVVDIQSANDLKHATAGKMYVEKLILPNGDAELIILVDRCETNHLFLTKGDLPGILPQMTATFTDIEEKSCKVNLQYHSRCPDLTTESTIILTLREDLQVRANKAVIILKELLEHSDHLN